MRRLGTTWDVSGDPLTGRLGCPTLMLPTPLCLIGLVALVQIVVGYRQASSVLGRFFQECQR